jgi:uncharacterized membrane protein
MVSELTHATAHVPPHDTPVTAALIRPVAPIASDIDGGEIEIPLTPRFGGVGSSGGALSRPQLVQRIVALMSALSRACISSCSCDYLGGLSPTTGVTVRAHLAFAAFAILSCAGPRDTAVDSPAADTSARPQNGATPWDAARQRGVDFRAIGQEPGWMVEIDREKSIEVVADYGEKKASTPVPVPRDSAGAIIYEATTEANRLTITIREAACNDTMSGEAMTHTVTMILNGTEYRGCGRYLGDRG